MVKKYPQLILSSLQGDAMMDKQMVEEKMKVWTKEQNRVRRGQCGLILVGYGEDVVTNGEMDEATVKAIKKFQGDNNLERTGEFDDSTWVRLDEELSDEKVSDDVSDKQLQAAYILNGLDAEGDLIADGTMSELWLAIMRAGALRNIQDGYTTELVEK